MVKVLYTRVQESLPSGLYQEYLSLLPPLLQEKNTRFVQWNDRLLHLAGQLLLREALQETYGSNDCLQQIKYNQYNRPYLPGGFDFNISHSGEYAICLIADGMQVGVDIEEIRDINPDEFADVMTAAQWRQIQQAPDPTRTFFTYWTIKESVIKADSRGLSIPLQDIIIENDKAFCDGRTWFLKALPVDREYGACMATSKAVEDITFRQIHLNNFKLL